MPADQRADPKSCISDTSGGPDSNINLEQAMDVHYDLEGSEKGKV